GEARYPSARGCAGGAIGTEAVPAVGGLRDSAGAPWERGDVARTSALPPPNHALERTGHSGHPWPAWGCPCGPPLTASVRLLYNAQKEENMATSDMTMNLLHEVERLRPLIKDNAASAEANRQLSSAV